MNITWKMIVLISINEQILLYKTFDRTFFDGEFSENYRLSEQKFSPVNLVKKICRLLDKDNYIMDVFHRDEIQDICLGEYFKTISTICLEELY